MARGLVIFGAIVVTLILLFGDIDNASGVCIMSYCKTEAAAIPTHSYITNTHRQIVGDLYNPDTGHIQIRDNSRRIIGYIERGGRITNPHRQKIGEINER